MKRSAICFQKANKLAELSDFVLNSGSEIVKFSGDCRNQAIVKYMKNVEIAMFVEYYASGKMGVFLFRGVIHHIISKLLEKRELFMQPKSQTLHFLKNVDFGSCPGKIENNTTTSGL